eukprot:m.67291 g.67291  ORF g.67291 m.67291 type:complete len:71 (-) comp15970_c0_seq4:43-255(-)
MSYPAVVIAFSTLPIVLGDKHYEGLPRDISAAAVIAKNHSHFFHNWVMRSARNPHRHNARSYDGACIVPY